MGIIQAQPIRGSVFLLPSMNEHYQRVLKLYGTTHTISVVIGNQCALHKLKPGQSVCVGDGKSFYFLLTAIDRTEQTKENPHVGYAKVIDRELVAKLLINDADVIDAIREAMDAKSNSSEKKISDDLDQIVKLMRHSVSPSRMLDPREEYIVGLYLPPNNHTVRKITELYNEEAKKMKWPEYSEERIRQMLRKPLHPDGDVLVDDLPKGRLQS